MAKVEESSLARIVESPVEFDYRGLHVHGTIQSVSSDSDEMQVKIITAEPEERQAEVGVADGFLLVNFSTVQNLVFLRRAERNVSAPRGYRRGRRHVLRERMPAAKPRRHTLTLAALSGCASEFSFCDMDEETKRLVAQVVSHIEPVYDKDKQFYDTLRL